MNAIEIQKVQHTNLNQNMHTKKIVHSSIPRQVIQK